ncbi:MAG TPA: maleylpyruvate isomerase N-terminal domain-containing protein [Gemmatimonadales bacterium]|jgi:uncharacterized protein (TIGR03083 family)
MRGRSPQIAVMIEGTRTLRPMEPLLVHDLFPPLHGELIALLRGLRNDDWARPTLCALWSVRDIAAHLLDDDLRRLSFHRDGHRLPRVPRDASEPALVEFINALNAEWVTAARRLSPRVITDLLDITGPQVAALFASLDPFGPAHFPVSWAGEDQSANWFDIGRDYTERWLHQQQIRVAVGAPGLLEPRWLGPVLDLFIRALPHTYRSVDRTTGTAITVHITGDAGGRWTLLRESGRWRLFQGILPDAAAAVTMSADTAWRLFSKALTTDTDRAGIAISGDRTLGARILGTLGIIA